MDKILTFDGEFFFLSNFYPCSIVWNDMVWKSSEHPYQAAKSTDMKVWKRIQELDTPAKTKKAGKTIQIRDDWDVVKFNIMHSIVSAKFHQNPDLRRKLLDTGDSVLEEGNWWRDTYWGISPAGSGNGQNNLGIILMTIRSEFKNGV